MPTSNHHVRERQRLDFAKIQGTIQIPNLIEVQMKSYQRFLQMDLLPSERDDGGLQSVFTSVFPIKDFREMSQLEFVDYAIGNWECKCGNLKGLHHLRATCRHCGASVVTNPYQTGDVICHKCGTFNKNTPTFCNKCGDPVAMQLKYDVNECQERGMTYSAPLKVTIRLTIYDKDPDTGAKTIRDIKEQEVFYGDIPLMTENGTFIINGTERVIVSQLHRSPGVFFESANNRSYFLGKIIPYRGSWVEFEYDTKNILYVRIDRKRKFLGSIFLRALGMKSNEDILRTFYQVERISLRDKDLFWNVSPGIVDRKLAHEIRNPKSDEVIVGAHKRITENLFKELIKAKISQVRAALADLEGAYSVADVVNRTTGEVLLEANKPLTADLWQAFSEGGITEVDVFFPERDDIGLVLSRTLDKDSIRSSKEALIEIYRKLRPGDPPTLETATNLFPSATTSAWCYRARSTRTRSALRRKRSSKSTASCARAIHRRWKRPRIFSRARRHRLGAIAHARQGLDPLFEGSAHRNLPQAAPGRSTDAGNGHESFPGHVLRPAQVRLQPRWPLEIQHQDGPGHATG